ncbi:hypothetical protein VMCG_09775 [Cytospora schulzeri]|uniref:Uncharacterized protein n=1 Tax=Cytospora schulzeri TaxID=448051 RepID=A0A423VGT1_9PEZI|nr:hypothetical protein VMCG_09775 [Valsa malicola]
MAIHADFQGRYGHVFEKASPSRDKYPMSSHPASPTSRISTSLPHTSCAAPSTSPPTRLSSQRQDFQIFRTPERPPEFCRTASKRRRAIHDVDGPHTGTLGCKKRRLRRELITSRLSRPFSSPATHILNREAAAGGKRFLKMAAAAAARKVTSVVIPTPPPTDWDLGAKVAAAQVATVIPANNIHPLAPAEMIRRAAIMNRFRIRVCDEARQRGDRTDLELTASAALLRASTGLHGVGFVADPKTSQGIKPAASRQDSQSQSTSLTSRTMPSASKGGTVSPPSARPQSPSRTFTGARSSPPKSPSKSMQPLSRGCPSPRLRPIRSPDLHAARAQGGAESAGDDEQLSFSATDYRACQSRAPTVQQQQAFQLFKVANALPSLMPHFEFSWPATSFQCPTASIQPLNAIPRLNLVFDNLLDSVIGVHLPIKPQPTSA